MSKHEKDRMAKKDKLVSPHHPDPQVSLHAVDEIGVAMFYHDLMFDELRMFPEVLSKQAQEFEGGHV